MSSKSHPRRVKPSFPSDFLEREGRLDLTMCCLSQSDSSAA
ncbi:MAG: hypothetical protein ACK578_19295 [Pirellula sp.]